MSKTKQPSKNDRNISAKIVAGTFENEIGSQEVSGEKVLEKLQVLFR